MSLRNSFKFRLGSEEMDCSPFSRMPLVLNESPFSFSMTYSQVGGYVFSPAYDSEKPRTLSCSIICKGKSDQDGYALFKSFLNRMMIHQNAKENIYLINDTSGRSCKVFFEGYSNVKVIGRTDCTATITLRQLTPWAVSTSTTIGGSLVVGGLGSIPVTTSYAEVDLSFATFGDFPSMLAPIVYFTGAPIDNKVTFGISDTSNVADVIDVMAINCPPILEAKFNYGVQVDPGNGIYRVKKSKPGEIPPVLGRKIADDGYLYMDQTLKTLVEINKNTHLWIKATKPEKVGSVQVYLTSYFMEA